VAKVIERNATVVVEVIMVTALPAERGSTRVANVRVASVRADE
jgi:hypothetical protein